MNTYKVYIPDSGHKCVKYSLNSSNIQIACILYAISDECLEEIRLMHLKLLLQEGPKDLPDVAITAQSKWNQEITDDHRVFKSFLCSIVGNDIKTQRITFETILEKCNNWQQHNWKTIMLLLRMVIDTGQEFKSQDLNDFKKITKRLY